MKEIINKLEFIKVKNVCPVTDTVKRMRRQDTDLFLQIKNCYPKVHETLKIQQ